MRLAPCLPLIALAVGLCAGTPFPARGVLSSVSLAAQGRQDRLAAPPRGAGLGLRWGAAGEGRPRAMAGGSLGLRGGGGGEEFVLHYKTHWAACFAHFSVDDGKTWTSKKGGSGSGFDSDPEVTEESTIGSGWKLFRFKRPAAAKTLRIVLHDGRGNWDSKPKGSEQSYYELTSAAPHVLMDAILTKVESPKVGEPVLVVTDLDGTLVGDDGAQADFFDHWQRQQAPRGSVLVFNTGRSIDSAQKLRKDKGLLAPRAVIGSVGTEVWWGDGAGGFKVDEEWRGGLRAGGAWDRELVCRLAKRFVDKEWAHFRPDDEQNEFKAVLGVRSERVEEVIAAMEGGVREAGKRAKFIYSGHGDWNYLDIVVEGAGKLEAMIYVRGKLGFPPERTLACGDSGNDILMLSGKERGVAVGNSQEGLLKWIRTRDEKGSADRLFCAKKGHARGILEALAHMGFAK